MKPIHVFTCGATEFQTTAKDKRTAERDLAGYIKEEGLSGTVKDWTYGGSYDPNARVRATVARYYRLWETNNERMKA